MYLRHLALILTFICLPVVASNDAVTANKAHSAYQQALQAVIAHWTPLVGGHGISFVEVSEGKSGDRQANTKRVRLDSEGMEHLESNGLNTANSDEASLNWQSSMVVDPRRFPDNAELIGETEKTWIFSIPTQINADVDDVEQNVDGDKVNNVLMSTIASELTISKLAPQFISQKVYAKHPFKPDNMVKVNEFNVRIQYSQAWPDGPWVTESISRIVKGKYAFFINVDEFSVMTYSDFQLVNEVASQ